MQYIITKGSNLFVMPNFKMAQKVAKDLALSHGGYSFIQVVGVRSDGSFQFIFRKSCSDWICRKTK